MKISDIKIAVARKKLLSLAEGKTEKGDTRKMAIILDAEDEDSLQPFLQLKKDLNLQDEDVQLVLCRNKGLKNDISEYPLISLNDFGWDGSANEETAAFLENEYDVLISFTATENKMADFLVSVTRARLKVGRKSEDKTGIFDLNISADLSRPQIFTEELKKYLLIIKTTA